MDEIAVQRFGKTTSGRNLTPRHGLLGWTLYENVQLSGLGSRVFVSCRRVAILFAQFEHAFLFRVTGG
ncbi:hypothetical protein ASG84_20635 [Rhodococcus sp. Leaf278]|nr:hypothetical protein ASG84_20635 [Rhodococcus sp. Leaf278]